MSTAPCENGAHSRKEAEKAETARSVNNLTPEDSIEVLADYCRKVCGCKTPRYRFSSKEDGAFEAVLSLPVSSGVENPCSASAPTKLKAKALSAQEMCKLLYKEGFIDENCSPVEKEQKRELTASAEGPPNGNDSAEATEKPKWPVETEKFEAPRTIQSAFERPPGMAEKFRLNVGGRKQGKGRKGSHMDGLKKSALSVPKKLAAKKIAVSTEGKNADQEVDVLTSQNCEEFRGKTMPNVTEFVTPEMKMTPEQCIEKVNIFCRDNYGNVSPSNEQRADKYGTHYCLMRMPKSSGITESFLGAGSSGRKAQGVAALRACIYLYDGKYVDDKFKATDLIKTSRVKKRSREDTIDKPSVKRTKLETNFWFQSSTSRAEGLLGSPHIFCQQHGPVSLAGFEPYAFASKAFYTTKIPEGRYDDTTADMEADNGKFLKWDILHEESLNHERFFLSPKTGGRPLLAHECLSLLTFFCDAYLEKSRARYTFWRESDGEFFCEIALPNAFPIDSVRSEPSLSRKVAKSVAALFMCQQLLEKEYLEDDLSLKRVLPNGLYKLSQPTNKKDSESGTTDTVFDPPDDLKWQSEEEEDDLQVLVAKEWTLRCYEIESSRENMSDNSKCYERSIKFGILTRKRLLDGTDIQILELPSPRNVCSLKYQGTSQLDCIQLDEAREYCRRLFAMGARLVAHSLVFQTTQHSIPEYLLLPLDAERRIDWNRIRALNEFNFNIETMFQNLASRELDPKVFEKKVVLYIGDEHLNPHVTRSIKPRASVNSSRLVIFKEQFVETLRPGVRDKGTILETFFRNDPFARNTSSRIAFYLYPELCVMVPCEPIALFIVRQLPFFERHIAVAALKKRMQISDNISLNSFSTCLTPRGIADDQDECYERMEYFGDLVLCLFMSKILFVNNPQLSQGDLTNTRGEYVSNKRLQTIAEELELHRSLLYTSSTSKLRIWPSRFGARLLQAYTMPLSIKIQADCIEAFVGLITSQQGLQAADFFCTSLDVTTDYFSNHVRPTTSPAAAASGFQHLLQASEETIHYKFKHPNLLIEAMVHPSLNAGFSYERLEFLGDAVLNFLVGQFFFNKFPSASPHGLSALSSVGKSNQMYGMMAHSFGIHKLLRYRSESISQTITLFTEALESQAVHGRGKLEHLPEPPKALADAFEAVAASIFLDSGGSLDQVWQVFGETFDVKLTKVERMHTKDMDSITFLAIEAAKYKQELHLNYREEKSAIFEPSVVICCVQFGKWLIATASAISRADAAKAACVQAVEFLKRLNNPDS